jgi:hypothetical protein
MLGDQNREAIDSAHAGVGGCDTTSGVCFICPMAVVGKHSIGCTRWIVSGHYIRQRPLPSISELPIHVEGRHAQPVPSRELTSDEWRRVCTSPFLRDMALAAVIDQCPAICTFKIMAHRVNRILECSHWLHRRRLPHDEKKKKIKT